MSFLGGPECSTAANPLAQFSKQSQSDTSLQRDRLASRQPQNLGFRSQQPTQADDAAFHDFAQQGAPQFGGAQLPSDHFHFEQLRRETERIERGGDGWAGEFAGNGSGPPTLEQMKMNNAGPAWSTNEFAQFRDGQHAQQRFDSASPVSQGMTQQYRPMYGGGFSAMQRPMFQSNFYRPELETQQLNGKGKERVQELSDTDWEKQFEELSTEDQRLKDWEDTQDGQANKDMEAELNDLDR